MTTRKLIAVALCAFAGIGPVVGRDFTVASSAEVLSAQRDAYFTSFTAVDGLKLHVVTWDGSQAALRANAELWDVVLTGGTTLVTACADGTLGKVDWNVVGGRDHYQGAAASDCGVGALVREVVLAWNRDKFQGVPSWSDFWDVAKYPGKRGLQRGARMNLEIALMADGVGFGDVYRILRTDDGVDRAFRKLDQIKPYLVWWKSGAQATALIESGNVLLCTATNDRVASVNQAGPRQFGRQIAGGLYEVESWAIPKASPNQADAARLVAFMGDPAREAHFAALTGLGVLAKGVTDGLTPERLATSPSNPALLGSALQVDDQFWRDNADKLDERFDAWLAH